MAGTTLSPHLPCLQVFIRYITLSQRPPNTAAIQKGKGQPINEGDQFQGWGK